MFCDDPDEWKIPRKTSICAELFFYINKVNGSNGALMVN